MYHIVFIGTPKNAPPGANNKELIINISLSSIDIGNVELGYLHPNIFEKVSIKKFFARAAFIFPNNPNNINEIKDCDYVDDMESMYPYQKIYNKIQSTMDGKLYHGYASWWIDKEEKKEK